MPTIGPRHSTLRWPHQAPPWPFRINWDHPLSEACLVFAIVGPRWPIELCAHKPFYRQGEPGIRGERNGLVATDTDGSNDVWRLDNAYTFDVTTSPPSGISYAARWYSDVSQSDERVFSMGRGSSNTGFLTFDQETTGIESLFQTSGSNNAGKGTLPGASYATGDLRGVYSLDYENHIDASVRRGTIWVNGGNKAITGSQTWTETWTLDRVAIGALQRTSTVSYFDGSVSWALAWNRGLRQDEADALGEAGGHYPLTMLESVAARTWFLPAAAAPSGLPPQGIARDGAIGGRQIDGAMIS